MVADIGVRYIGVEAPAPEEWMEEAACVWQDPQVFFPTSKEAEERAKKVCGRCTVRIKCLAYTLSAEKGHRRYGVSGGMNGKERKKIAALLEKSINEEKEEDNG